MSPSEVCFEKNFYSIYENFKRKNPNFSDYHGLHVENETFKKLENVYGKYLHEKVTKQRILTTEDAQLLCDFILQIKIRNPFYRNEDISNNFSNILANAVALVEEDVELAAQYKSIPQVLKKAVIDQVANDHKTDVDFAKNSQLFSLIYRGENPRRVSLPRQAMLKHCWTLLIAPADGPYFIATDNPGISFDESTFGYYNTRFTGLFKFYFPLSFRYCLLINGSEIDKSYLKKRKEKILTGKPISSREVYHVNDKVIRIINNKIMSYDRDYLDKLIETSLKIR